MSFPGSSPDGRRGSRSGPVPVGGSGKRREGRGGSGRRSMVPRPQPPPQQYQNSQYHHQQQQELQELPHAFPSYGGHPSYHDHQQNQRDQRLQMPLSDPHNAYSNAWLVAFDEATICLLTYTATSLYPVAPPRATSGEMEFATAYLSTLERVLYQYPMECWDFPPTKNPPKYSSFQPPALLAMGNDFSDATTKHDGSRQPGAPLPGSPGSTSQSRSAANTTSTAVTPSPTSQKRRIQLPLKPSSATTNRYSIFLSPDSDDDVDAQDMKEAGDFPVLNFDLTAAVLQGDLGVGGMDIRRLVLRVCCAQSDLWAFLAMERAHTQQWEAGVKGYHFSCLKTRQALELADAEITKWWYEEMQYEQRQQVRHLDTSAASDRMKKKKDARKEQLMADADIVVVAIQHLIQKRDKYVAAAERKQDWLLHKLAPQWKNRDDVKHKWGKARWANNPKPKHDFAMLREAHELELNAVQQALAFISDHLQSSVVAQLEATSKKWQSRFFNKSASPKKTTSASSLVSHSTTTTATSISRRSTSRKARV
jgi:hypothetical protein